MAKYFLHSIILIDYFAILFIIASDYFTVNKIVSSMYYFDWLTSLLTKFH